MTVELSSSNAQVFSSIYIDEEKSESEVQLFSRERAFAKIAILSQESFSKKVFIGLIAALMSLD